MNTLSIRHLFARLCLAAGLTITVAGCGGGAARNPDWPELESVTGVVMLDGAPVEEATVTFSPLSKDAKMAGAITDAEGKFTLKTFLSASFVEDGAVAGDYAVTITKRGETPLLGGIAPPGPDATDEEYETYQEKIDNAYGELIARGEQPPEAPYIVPKRYGSRNESGFKFTVAAGENDFPLELTSGE